jgi:uncharacterized protein (DUF1684 family)
MRRKDAVRSHPIAITLIVAAACGGHDRATIDPAEHQAAVDAWRQKRDADLRKPDGWLSLVGLYWLDEGDNVFGSAPENDIIYDGKGTPERIGVFTVAAGRVTVTPDPGVSVKTDSAGWTGGEMLTDGDGPPTALDLGPLRWYAIERERRLAVRLKDSTAGTLTEFAGVELYPLAANRRVAGRFRAYDPPREIEVPNIFGSLVMMKSHGAVEFDLDGASYSLVTWEDSDDPLNLFTAFADSTNGRGTYGGGRFLWIDAPDEKGRLVVDFNRAYNPPCVFTEFATCPLPPRQNRLPLAIEAGERLYASH